MKQKDGLALIALFLIKNNKSLKSSTSKHAKKMNFGHETGQNGSDFKKKVDIPVGKNTPQVPVARKMP